MKDKLKELERRTDELVREAWCDQAGDDVMPHLKREAKLLKWIKKNFVPKPGTIK